MNSFSQIFKHCIDIGYDKIPESDYEFFVVAFHDEKDDTIFRKDMDANEIRKLILSINPEYKILIKGISQYSGCPIMLHAWV